MRMAVSDVDAFVCATRTWSSRSADVSKLRAHPLPCVATRQRSAGVALPGVADGARVALPGVTDGGRGALPGVADDARRTLAGVTGVSASCRRGALGGVPVMWAANTASAGESSGDVLDVASSGDVVGAAGRVKRRHGRREPVHIYALG